MKRIKKTILAFVVGASLVSATPVAAEAAQKTAHPDILCGDADGNGMIQIQDATAVQRYVTEFGDPDGVKQTNDKALMDANGDGKVDIFDVTELQRYVAEITVDNVDLGTCAYKWNGGKYVRHIHNWQKSWDKIRSGYACNQCYKDVTGWDDMYDCHGGWHTHQWCDEPSSEACSECGAKRHMHYWAYIMPSYVGDTIRRRGYYFCYQCFNFSEDGIHINNSIQKNCNNWVTIFDFSKTDYHLGIEYTQPKTDPLDHIQYISLNGLNSMAPGETAEFSVSFTPGQTRCDKSITWSSSDPSVISVDKNGKVTAKKIGTATIPRKRFKFWYAC